MKMTSKMMTANKYDDDNNKKVPKNWDQLYVKENDLKKVNKLKDEGHLK